MPPVLARSGLGFIAGLAITGPSIAQAPAGNALMLFDSYLARAALTHPAYRTDLRLGAEPGGPPPGRLAGESPLVGAFTYRARTFRELSREERAALLRDPGFRAFLIAAHEEAERKAAAARIVEIPPEELLKPGPLYLVLRSP